MKIKDIICVGICSLLLFTIGCGKSEQGILIQGTASFNGEPIQLGRIAFFNDQDVSTMFTIRDGRFEGRIIPGEMLVRVWGDKTVKLDKPIYMEDTQETISESYEQYLPEKFNTKSELKKSITPDTKTVDFNLNDKAV